jgi:hypothetical protein
MRYPTSRRRFSPRLEALECRDTPAGTVTASLAGGVLTLRGDALANHIELDVTAQGSTSVVEVLGVGTTIAGTEGPYAGVRSIRAFLLGGDDTITTFTVPPEGGNTFELTGAAEFDLGDGANRLDLTPRFFNVRGGFQVRAGDGPDTVSLAGDGRLGSLDLALGDGDTTTTLSDGGEFTMFEAGSFRFAVGEGNDALTMTEFSVGREGNLLYKGGPVSIDGGAGDLVVVLDEFEAGRTIVAALGSVSVEARGIVSLGRTAVTGREATLTARVATQVSLLQTDRLDVLGAVAAAVVAEPANQVLGFEGSKVYAYAASSIVATAGTARLEARGETATFDGLTVRGAEAVGVVYATTARDTEVDEDATSRVWGRLAITGGPGDDTVTVNDNLRALGDVAINLGGGTNTTILGTDANDLDFFGRFTYIGGGGTDAISLTRLGVSNAVAISTLGGSDSVDIQNGTKLFGTTRIDQGTGNDSLAIATRPAGAGAPVVFYKPLTVQQGTGDDTLSLGLAGSPGDANAVWFVVGGNTFDGGLDFNVFDDEAGKYDVPKVRFFNYADPT